MWTGPDSRTEQYRVRAAADKGPFDVTMTFLDHDKPVTVQASPAKDTDGIAETMKGARQG
ncbi:hypothetical protein [Streptomyces rhizosphaerihabitans]|uniref:hypothetical protein n=1 Tax=Streptomyces rhizosphaerihabitans TaxID=1266770 RepID=UPI0021BF5784|nr:hypothetical protein [Streptomyces rhizosphaerihabitans]MCT9006923.1 hypothetical protein [Streptomyces rhizosphaerihabitans]